MTTDSRSHTRFSGRVSSLPNQFLHNEILKPQFDYELEHLLPFYIQIEQVMTKEYERMGLISQTSSQEIITVLQKNRL